MAKTIVGLYDNLADARQVVEDLTTAGFHRDKISLVASDATGEYSSHLGTTTHTTTDTTTDTDRESSSGTGAATGAVAGGLLGGLAGVLLGLGALAIPGVGPIIAAGPIVSGLVGAGVGAASGGLLGALVGMGVSKEEAECYSEGVRRGGTLVTVNAPDDRVDRVVEIMNRYNPVDVEKRSAEWRGQGWTGYDPNAGTYAGTAAHTGTTHTGTTAHTTASKVVGTTGHERDTLRSTEGKTTIPIVEEEVRVGKRAVERGGVRVHTFIEEKPFQEDVHLRQEQVHVERHAVDRPASEADLKSFKEGTFELRERGEEAVVSKHARVVEEVVIGKDVREHTETVHDTVRRTGVTVDDTTGTTRTSDVDRFGADREYFRNHFKTNYSKLGGTYEDFEPAYRSGYTLGYDDRYKTYNRWEDLEPEARRVWEKDNRGGVWDKTKDAVRHGWERAKRAV